MNVLVLNCGSSSIKYKLFAMDRGGILAAGVIEQIGEHEARQTHQWNVEDNKHQQQITHSRIGNHSRALETIFDQLQKSKLIGDTKDLHGIGHRVVHGGKYFHEPVLIDQQVIAAIRSMIALAPLHNPANLSGIEAAQAFAPWVPQVAVFDTAFHQTIPLHAHIYALPYEYYEKMHIRRYGFHGISHQYVTRQTAKLLNTDMPSLNLISLHLGNGASATAIKQGKSIDTSMGMTPLEGLMMGSRCGDLDPSIPFFLEKQLQLDSSGVEAILNNESGLKGLCGDNDMRAIQERADNDDHRAKLAIDSFCYRIRKYIGAYKALLGEVQALVFTGGIGEHSPQVRALCCDGLEHMGIILDPSRNQECLNASNEIQRVDAETKIFVVQCDEEGEIAQQSMDKIRGQN